MVRAYEGKKEDERVRREGKEGNDDDDAMRKKKLALRKS